MTPASTSSGGGSTSTEGPAPSIGISGRAYSLLNSLAPFSTLHFPTLEDTHPGDIPSPPGSATIRPAHRRFWSQGPSSLPGRIYPHLTTSHVMNQINASHVLSTRGAGHETETRGKQKARADDGDRGVLSTKHVEQALRLANQALEEDAATERESEREFVADLYFSSLDYFLGACKPSLFTSLPGPKRKELVAKASVLLHSLEDHTSSDDSESTPSPDEIRQPSSSGTPPGGLNDLRTYVMNSLPAIVQGRRPVTPPEHVNHSQIAGETPSADQVVLHALCTCGRSVWIPVPDELRSVKEVDGHPKTWSELWIAFLVWAAIALKQSPIPTLIGTAFTALLSFLVYLNGRFQLGVCLFLAFNWVLERAVETDRRYQVHQRLAELVSVLFEGMARASVAFADARRSEDRDQEWQPPESTLVHSQRSPPPKTSTSVPISGRGISSASSSSPPRATPAPIAMTSTTSLPFTLPVVPLFGLSGIVRRSIPRRGTSPPTQRMSEQPPPYDVRDIR
ncbi:hypothetical protein PUNSTDRAFT_47789 [Punctularia strigosozonata HHB-11173 SS5]|uniref:Uncharacterized protein n=1 Tax=Punctularia strigosozonata (strain HHB-11173) TaxID=741275 RepID=R7S1A2_PUNST|nr:uncharacterized protein PUNSTDRAFT_47789 [Punctularia strigosozonata HHB-11173 SS5]EIN04003.1 hypothetical protein PUNSTDRAFT_47789 [Punctularia strigosozonata HHB-11173 SS5]